MLQKPLKLHFNQAREAANDNRLKFPRLHSDMTKLSEQGHELILESVVLIDYADALIAKNKTLLRGGHPNPAMLPMLEEAWKWIKTSRKQAIECAREVKSARTGLMTEWLDLECQWLTIFVEIGSPNIAVNRTVSLKFIARGMSALGQKRTSREARLMSALPPKADIETQSRDVRYVPKADSCTAANRR